MDKKHSIPFVLCLIFSSIFLIYANSFNASWHLDDYENIVQNSKIHIQDLSFKSLKQTFFASSDRGIFAETSLYRPLPMLSFALNWYFGKNNVWGYHLVNIIIHCLTALLLYFCLYSLFLESPHGKTNFNPCAIALLSALLWAIHPIQVQSVTYIVQRMTSLAGLFYLVSLLGYIRFRLSSQRSYKIQWLLCSFLAFMAAVMSKENAITLPLNILLLEFVFFKGLGKRSVQKQFYLVSLILLVVGGVLTTYVLMGNNFLGLLDNYDVRSFSPGQRLLTQPRVIAMYIGKIFFPLPYQYSIDHDLFHSTSILSPWTTLPSIIVSFALIGLGVACLVRLPWLGFGILFFFIAHGVESSMLSLELVFEHRNYVPSMFLFPPIALGLVGALEKYRNRSHMVYIALACFISTIVISLGLGTRARNFDWHSEISLWEDALKKAPKSARSHQNYALALYRHSKKPDIDYIVKMNLEATELLDHKNSQYAETVSFNNLSGLYRDQGDYHKALFYAEKAAEINPASNLLQYKLARCFVDTGKLEPALKTVNKLTEADSVVLDDLILKTEILFRIGDIQGAESIVSEIMKKAPLSPIARKYKAFSDFLGGDYKGAEHYLKQLAVHEKGEDLIFLRLLLAQIYRRMGDIENFNNTLDSLISEFPIRKLKAVLNQNDGEKFPVIRLPVEALRSSINNRLPL